jgi:hypothetical protein
VAWLMENTGRIAEIPLLVDDPIIALLNIQFCFMSILPSVEPEFEVLPVRSPA